MANPFVSSGPRPMGPRRPYYNPHAVKALRKNERIRSPEVRVIGPDGRQIGIIATREALRIAQGHQLDLVEVSPGAQPPVCRILDYGKYMYEEGKKQKGHKVHHAKLKEVKFRPRIEQHDYLTKLRHAEEFLFHGDKVKLTLFFKGREMEHKELGFETVNRAIGDLVHIGTPDQPPRMFGRNITLTLSPLPLNKRKWKYNLRDGHPPPHGPHDAHGHGHDGHEGHEHGHAEPPPPASPTPVANAANKPNPAAKPSAPGQPTTNA